jgi:hypothetical protein
MVQRLAGNQEDLIKEFIQETKARAMDWFNSNRRPSGVQAELRDSMSGLQNAAISALTDIAVYESEFTAETISRYVDGLVDPVERGALITALMTNNMEINNINPGIGNDKSIAMAFKQFANRKADEMAQIIKDATYQDLDEADVEQQLDHHTDVTIGRQIISLAATAVVYASLVGRNETMTQADQVEYVEWVLDDNVQQHTDYCLEHEGNIYVAGDSPVPPAHWGCQSDLVPYFGNNPKIAEADSDED